MQLLDDFRQAWRGLSHNLGFLLLSGGVLALGLATTIFMYAVTDSMLNQTPPFPQADRLVMIYNSEPARNSYGNDFSYPDFGEMRAAQRTLSSVSGLYTGTMTFSGNGLPERVSGSFVAPNFLETLRVAPVLGRAFTIEDYAPGAPAVVLLSHEYWRTRFASDANAVGMTLKLNGELAKIVGVLPEGFVYPTRNELAWTPIRRDPLRERRGDPEAIGVQLLGRLKEGASLEQARSEFEAISAQLAERYPQFNAGKQAQVATLAHGFTGRDGVRILKLMFYAVWAVLAIACANVASLIFVRANQRVYESTMRAALGARRSRLVILTLAESVIVAGVGALIALALAAVGLDVMRRAMTHLFEGMPTWWTYRINWSTVAFAVLVALVSGIVAGIWPAWRASRPDLMRILRDGGRTGTGMRLSAFTAVMVVIEVALAVVLLTASGIATRTALRTLSADVGVNSEGVMTGRVMLPEAAGSAHYKAEFFGRAARELANQPGVLAATAATVLPGVGAGDTTIAIEGSSYVDRSSYPVAQDVLTIPGFFSAFGVNLRAGRDFMGSDTLDSPPVAIINDAFVAKHFPDGNAIGKRIQVNTEEADSPWVTIVGIAPNINHDGQWEVLGVFEPVVYRSLMQYPTRFVSVAIRVSGDPTRFTDTLRQTIGRMQSESPVYFLGSLRERQDLTRGGMKIVSGMFSTFATIAILLAAVGLYGVLAFTTSQRTREIGIRRAMGARRSQVLKSVLRGAALQLAIGLGIGAILAPLVAGILPTFVTGGLPHDPWVYSAVFGLVALCALGASWMPAVRALAVQPAIALRYE